MASKAAKSWQRWHRFFFQILDLLRHGGHPLLEVLDLPFYGIDLLLELLDLQLLNENF